LVPLKPKELFPEEGNRLRWVIDFGFSGNCKGLDKVSSIPVFFWETFLGGRKKDSFSFKREGFYKAFLLVEETGC